MPCVRVGHLCKDRSLSKLAQPPAFSRTPSECTSTTFAATTMCRPRPTSCSSNLLDCRYIYHLLLHVMRWLVSNSWVSRHVQLHGASWRCIGNSGFSGCAEGDHADPCNCHEGGTDARSQNAATVALHLCLWHCVVVNSRRSASCQIS